MNSDLDTQTNRDINRYLAQLGLQIGILQQPWTNKHYQIDLKADRQKRATDTATNAAIMAMLTCLFNNTYIVPTLGQAHINLLNFVLITTL